MNHGDESEKLKDQIILLESKYNAQEKNMNETIERLVHKSMNEAYDKRMINEEQLRQQEKLLEQKIKLIENNAGEKYQKEKKEKKTMD